MEDNSLRSDTSVNNHRKFLAQVTDLLFDASVGTVLTSLRQSQQDVLRLSELPAHSPSNVRLFDTQATDQTLYKDRSTRSWLDGLFQFYGFHCLPDLGISDDDEDWPLDCIDQVQTSICKDDITYPVRHTFRFPLKQSMGKGKHFSFSEVSVRFLIPDPERLIGRTQASPEDDLLRLDSDKHLQPIFHVVIPHFQV